MFNEKKMPRKVMDLVEEATKDISTEARCSLIEQAVLYYRPNYKNCESFRGNFIPIIANAAINTADSIMEKSAVVTFAHYFSRWVYEDSVRRIADVADFLEILLKENFNGENHNCLEVDNHVASFMMHIEACVNPVMNGVIMPSYMSDKVDSVMCIHFTRMQKWAVIVQKMYRNSSALNTEEAIHRAVSSLRTIARETEKMSMEYAIDRCSCIITPSEKKRTDVLNNARIAVRATLVASVVNAISMYLISGQKDDSKTRRACMNRVVVGFIHCFITNWERGILRYLSSDAYPNDLMEMVFPEIPDSANYQNHNTK